jgi:hypothetical protein
LRYTDPSGNEFVILGSMLLAAIVTGTAISVAVYIGTSLYFGTPITAGGIIGAAVIGAISGAVTFGIGSAATSGFANFYSKAAFQALSHGAFQGTMTSIQGGSFFAGFLAGSLSSIASSAWGGGKSYDVAGDKGVAVAGGFKGASNFLKLNNTAGTLFFGALAGGAGASLGGGNFWQGAVTGLVVSGLNHAMNHGARKNYLRNKIFNSGRNPDDPANIESSQLNGFAEEILPTAMEQTDSPTFVLKDKLTGQNYNQSGSQNYGETPVYSNDNKTFKASGVINISRVALRSWLTLASTMGHELNHFYHFSSGLFDKWVSRHGIDYANARTEWHSQVWELKYGGIPSL